MWWSLRSTRRWCARNSTSVCVCPAGVKQDPPLPVRVELAEGGREDPALAEAIGALVRDVLVVQADVELVPWGSLRRSEYKSKLIED